MSLLLFFLLLAPTADELYRRGTEAFRRGQFDEAVQLLTQAAQGNPKSAQMWKALGVAYAASANYEAAVEPFRQACTLDSKLADACYYYGRNLYALNRFEPALEAFRKAPKDARVTLAIAQAHEARGSTKDAESMFRKAIEEGSSPNADYDPQLHYAVFLYRLGRTAEALAPAEAALKRHPRSGRAHFEVGRIHFALGHLDKAATTLEGAVQFGHGAPAHLLLGKTYMRLGKADAAEPHLKAGGAAVQEP